jgi:hypothetical protein
METESETVEGFTADLPSLVVTDPGRSREIHLHIYGLPATARIPAGS